MPVQLILIWYFLNVQKEKLCIITQKLHNYRNRCKEDNNHYYFVKCFVISLTFLPCVIFFIRTLYDCEVTKMWSYGYKIQSEIIRPVFSFYVVFGFYSCTTCIALVAFSLSIMFYKWGEVLNRYNKLLCIRLKQGKINEKIDFLKEFFHIVKILHKLDQALSYTSFIIIFYGLEMIFLVFSHIVLRKDNISEASFVVDLTFNGVFGFLLLMVYSLSSCMIPEKLTQIRKTAKYCITQYGDSPQIPANVIFFSYKNRKRGHCLYNCLRNVLDHTAIYTISDWNYPHV